MKKGISLNAYITLMMPHLLAKANKEMGNVLKDKALRGNLIKAIKTRLKAKYFQQDAEQLLQDISFSKSKTARKARNEINGFNDLTNDSQDSQKDKIFIWAKGCDKSKLSWIKSHRSEKMCHINKYLSAFMITLGKLGIAPIPYMPFVVNDSIYFADVYIPNFHIAISIKYPAQPNDRKCKVKDLRTIGVQCKTIYNYEACNPNFVKNLIKSLCYEMRRSVN